MSARTTTEIAAELAECARAWDPYARVVGNVTAAELARVLAAAERERAAADALAASCEEHESCPVHPHGSHADAEPPCVPCQHDRMRATLIRANLAAYRQARGAR